MKQERRAIFKKIKTLVQRESSPLIKCLNNFHVIFQSFYFYDSLKESRKFLFFYFICYYKNSGTKTHLKIILSLSCRKFNINTD